MNFSDPEKNIRQFELTPGMFVADFGAGSGFYTINAAQEVGENGKVYAVDIQKDLLTRIQHTARMQELGNVEIVWADLEKENGTKLQNESVDAVIMSNILFQVPNMETIVSEAYRILKFKGKVLVIDWSDTFDGMGPEKDSILPEHEARNLFEKKGFYIERNVLAGAHHYGFIARKTEDRT